MAVLLSFARAITEGSLFSGSSFSQLGSWAHGFMAHRLDFPIQSVMAELAARTGVNSDHDGVVFTKLKYRFIVFSVGYFFLVFGIFRYFGIPASVSISVF